MLTAVVLAASLFTVAQSTSDGGEGEGEANTCERACLDANTLEFCDAGTLTTLDCSDVDDDAVCGFHSARQGFDCLLPAGAACDASYAFGLSRCAPTLFCNAGVCSTTAPAATDPPRPTTGTKVEDEDSSTSSCGSCASSDASMWALVLAPALLLRWRRRRA